MWQPISTAPDEIKERCTDVLVAGQYPNGEWYVEVTFWNPRGHWNGRSISPPSHWQPMPAPPHPVR